MMRSIYPEPLSVFFWRTLYKMPREIVKWE
jgi:hypothetical protein